MISDSAIIRFLLYTVLIVCMTSCGSETEDTGVFLSGSLRYSGVDISDDSPVFVAVARGDTVTRLDSSLIDTVLTVVSPEPGNASYRIDLTESGLVPGDHIMVFGILDADYTGNFPWPTDGDYVGFYHDPQSMSPAFTVTSGENSGADLDICRRVYSYEASLSGTISGDYTGDVVVCAYSGTLPSMDYMTLENDRVIAWGVVPVTAPSTEYRIEIPPYGFDTPIENVTVYALGDTNGNRAADPGEQIGFYQPDYGGFPGRVTINEGDHSNIDIRMVMTLAESSTQPVSIRGALELPSDYDSETGALYIIVSDTDDYNALISSPAESILWFEQLDPGSKAYDISLGTSGLEAGDPVTVTALWDRDFTTGFPDLSPGDYVGYYSSTDTTGLSLYHCLNPGVNTGLDIEVNREITSFSASVSGTIHSPEGYSGQVRVFAYHGDITSMDLMSFDSGNFIAVEDVRADEPVTDYRMTILPFDSEGPVENVYILSLFDTNGNSVADPGESIGYFSMDDDGTPDCITVRQGENPGCDIRVLMVVPQPSPDVLSVRGTLNLPEMFDPEEGALFVLIYDTDNPEDILANGMDSVAAFERIENGTDYDLDLTRTHLRAGENVMIIALWDRDFSSGFPLNTPGDYIGFYNENSTASLALTLSAGGNAGVDIDVDRMMHPFEKTISGTIHEGDAVVEAAGDYSGDVIILAYRGDINSMDFTKMDFQQAIAYRKLVKFGDAPFDYSLTILPFGEDLPIAKVTIFALYDADSNGKPDPGEIIGYHATDTQLPVVLTIDDDVPVEGETDITMLITVPAPSGDALHLYGNADFGSGQIADAYNSDYHTQPAFLVIAQAQSIDELFNTSFMAVKYFGRIPNGLTDGKLDFFADLSGTGLRHGDTAMAFLLWDRDYSGGFPEVSKGDYAGYYLNAADYATEFTLNTGDNHLVTNDTWRFKVNRKVWFEAPFDDVTLSFSVTEGFSGMDYGDQLIVVGAERSGTSITDMSLDTDYVVFMEVFTVTEGEPVFDGSGDLTGVNGGNAARDESGNVRVFKTIPAIPTLMESIVTTDPSGEFLGIDGVYFMAVLDKNRNGLFDNGDYYGYYNSNVFIGSIIPESIDIEKGHTVLDSEIRLMTRQ